ncbi:MAG: ABC transporter ATP-binding protein [Acidimicrobiales bacterium]
MTNVLTMRGVGRTYGETPNQVTALDNVDFAVEEGELVAVMGPSGSGKSTLLTIAGGLESPSTGAVELDGTKMWSLPPSDIAAIRRTRIGFVFQGFNLLTGLTAAENVAAPLELDGVGAREANLDAVDRLEAVGLGDRADAFPEDLSGGERQRVAIARGLIGDRRLILADEPTGALDSTTGEGIMDLIRSVTHSNRSAVVVTHDDHVAGHADRVVRLRDGRIETA